MYGMRLQVQPVNQTTAALLQVLYKECMDDRMVQPINQTATTL